MVMVYGMGVALMGFALLVALTALPEPSLMVTVPRRGGSFTNVAVQVQLLYIWKEGGLRLVPKKAQSLPQPAKVEPLPGAAVRMTDVPAVYVSAPEKVPEPLSVLLPSLLIEMVYTHACVLQDWDVPGAGEGHSAPPYAGAGLVQLTERY